MKFSCGWADSQLCRPQAISGRPARLVDSGAAAGTNPRAGDYSERPLRPRERRDLAISNENLLVIIGAYIGDWLAPQLGILLGAGLIAAILDATIGALSLLVVLRLSRSATLGRRLGARVEIASMRVGRAHRCAR